MSNNNVKAFIFNGDKKARIDDMPLEAWSNVAGGSSEGASSWASTAWQFRALTVIAEQVANLPYSIKDRESGEVVYDTDNDRGNFPAGMEWLTDFNELLHKTSISCKQEGAAYWLAVGLSKGNDYPGGKVLSLKWLKKNSVHPIFNIMGVAGFTRTVGNKTVQPECWPWQDVIYFWPPDPDVEIGPAMNYPGKSVKEEVNALWSLVHMFTKYFDRGLVAPFVLTYENTPTPEEQQSIKSYFTSLTTGLKNAFKLAMFRQDVKVQTLGDGLKQLPTSELESGRRLALMAGYGVPETKFVQSAANRATRELDERAFITDTIWPFADWLENQLNKQLFYKIGKVLNFHVERLDAMQTEELQGADSFAKLVAAGIHPETAAAMLGMEIPEGYTLTGGKEGESEEPENEEEEPENDAEEIEEVDPADDMAQEEMATLRRWATKRIKQGKPLNGFKANHLTPFDVYLVVQESELKQLQNMSHINSPMAVRILNRFQDEMNGLTQRLSNGTMTRAEFDDRFKALIALTLQQLFSIGAGEDYENLPAEKQAVIDSMVQEQQDYSESIIIALAAGEYQDDPAGLSNRVGLWVSILGGALFLGRMWGDDNKKLVWRLGGTIEHCTTCSSLNGQVKTAKEWRESGYQPQGSMLECKGFHCQCGLYEV